MQELSRAQLRFAEDSHGAIAVTFGLILTVLIGFCAAAVDMARWQSAKSATQTALDSAVLAGGRALQLDPTDTDAALASARDYYEQNVRQRFSLKTDTINFTLAHNNTAITAVGQASIATVLLPIVGVTELPVFSSAEAPMARLAVGGSGGSSIEIAVMLDVTGSMCDDGNGPCTSSAKMDGLKQAAKDLIDIVVWDDQSNHTSRVALVPFSTRVRVGPDGGGGDMMKALTDLDPTWSGWRNICIDSSGSGSAGSETNGSSTWQCHQWEAQRMTNWKVKPCVTDRFYNNGWNYDYTDDAPGAGRWLNAHDGGRMTLSQDSSDGLLPGNNPSNNETGQTPVSPATHWNHDSSGGCSDVAEENEFLPLTSDKSLLHSRIDGLEAYGATAGALGTAWSWYTLSPNWVSVFPGESAPGSYGDLTTLQANGAPVLRKVAILMSDGVFNTYRNWKGQDQQKVSDYAKQLCTNMKAQGIEIYSVAFDLDSLPSAERAIAEDTLRSCGTDVEHFYDTLDPAQLQQAFRDIALKLSSLYLSK